MKPGSPLRPGEESAAAGVVLVTPSSREASSGETMTTSIVSAGLVLDVRADIIVDEVTSKLLKHYRRAIMAGQRAEGGPQRPLSKGRQNDPGRESTFRGFATGHLADNLRRTTITGSTVSAKSKILPPTDRNVFIATEARRGVGYLSVEGVAGEVAREAADAAVEFLTTGMRAEEGRSEASAVEAAKEG